MGDFEREGFLSILRETGVVADTVSVDAHLGYYFERTVLERLHHDVLQPARTRGYRRIVVVGVSLGGLGALLHERDHPGWVDALVLMAPYLGKEGRLFSQITASGGPVGWASERELREGAVEEQLWVHLGRNSQRLPETWLLYGRRDPFSVGHRLLSPLLPSTRVLSNEGAHDWPTWRALWRQLCAGPMVFGAEKQVPHPVPAGSP